MSFKNVFRVKINKILCLKFNTRPQMCPWIFSFWLNKQNSIDFKKVLHSRVTTVHHLHNNEAVRSPVGNMRRCLLSRYLYPLLGLCRCYFLEQCPGEETNMIVRGIFQRWKSWTGCIYLIFCTSGISMTKGMFWNSGGSSLASVTNTLTVSTTWKQETRKSQPQLKTQRHYFKATSFLIRNKWFA